MPIVFFVQRRAMAVQEWVYLFLASGSSLIGIRHGAWWLLNGGSSAAVRIAADQNPVSCDTRDMTVDSSQPFPVRCQRVHPNHPMHRQEPQLVPDQCARQSKNKGAPQPDTLAHHPPTNPPPPRLPFPPPRACPPLTTTIPTVLQGWWSSRAAAIFVATRCRSVCQGRCEWCVGVPGRP